LNGQVQQNDQKSTIKTANANIYNAKLNIYAEKIRKTKSCESHARNDNYASYENRGVYKNKSINIGAISRAER